MEAIRYITLARDILKAYEMRCKALCRDNRITQTAFDILMFLYNNPDNRTATDITLKRGIKPNLVSLYVDKLAASGYLERRPSNRDRRTVELRLTQQAMPLVKAGAQIQGRFYQSLSAGMTPAMLEAGRETLLVLETNLHELLKD